MNDERFEKLLCELLNLYWNDFELSFKIADVLNKCGFTKELFDFIAEKNEDVPF